MKKAIGMFMALIMALGMTGIAYACWYEELHIRGNVNTGYLDVTMYAGESRDTEPREKDVSWIECWVGPCGCTLWVNVYNAYPCIDYYQEFTITNTGSIPVHLYATPVYNPYPDVTVEVTDVNCIQLHPGEFITGTVHVHVEQSAAQLSSYYFEVDILANQWNLPPE